MIKTGKPCPECEKKVLIGMTMRACTDVEKEDKEGTQKKLGSSCDALFKKVMKKKVDVGQFIKKVDKAIPRVKGEERVFDAVLDIAKEKRLIK